jgi:hypothetical protein
VRAGVHEPDDGFVLDAVDCDWPAIRVTPAVAAATSNAVTNIRHRRIVSILPSTRVSYARRVGDRNATLNDIGFRSRLVKKRTGKVESRARGDGFNAKVAEAAGVFLLERTRVRAG